LDARLEGEGIGRELSLRLVYNRHLGCLCARDGSKKWCEQQHGRGSHPCPPWCGTGALHSQADRELSSAMERIGKPPTRVHFLDRARPCLVTARILEREIAGAKEGGV